MALRDRARRLHERDPRLFWLAALTLAFLAVYPVATAIAVALGHLRVGGVDFKAYYLAGLRVRHGVPLYEWGHFYDRVPDPFARKYLYPPVVALAFVPFTYLGPAAGHAAWVGLQVVALWVGVAALVRAYGVDLSTGEWVLVLWAVAGFEGVVRLVRIGNVSAGLAALLCLSGAAVVAGPGRGVLAGVPTVLAAVVKPFVAPAGAVLLRDWRRLAVAALAAAGLAGLSLLAFGVETHREYLALLTWGKDWGAWGHLGDLPGNWRPFYQFPAWKHRLQAALLAGTAVTALASRWARSPGVDERVFALGVVTAPLAAPTANSLTLVLAVPGLLVVLLSEARDDGTLWVPVLAVLLTHISHPAIQLFTTYAPLVDPLPWERIGATLLVLQPATVGLLLVYGLLVARVWRAIPLPAALAGRAAGPSRDTDE